MVIMEAFIANKTIKARPLPKRLPIFMMLAAGLGIYFSAASLGSQEVDLLISPGKLSKPHAHLSGMANCSQCHTEKKRADPLKCLACHRDLAERIKAGRGWHRGKNNGCITCHPEHQGEDFKLIEWDLKKFSHGETGFPLTGLHKKITDCAACHATANALPKKKGKTYLLKDVGCAACHPDPHRGQLGTRCAQCHSTDVPFRQVAFDHGKSKFPLNGAHKSLACASCHPNRQWKGLRFSRCSDCHADPHRPSFGNDCRSCHKETSWKTSKFNHDQTRFPLRGKHSALTCMQCHPRVEKGRKIAFANCSDCHRHDPHQGRFGNECQTCHVVEGFEKAAFNHDSTRFPLTGKHVALSCQKCHPKKAGDKAAAVKPLSTACRDCHADVHLKQFTKNCDACHTTRGFSGAALKFNHQTDSFFSLQGKHASLACQKCHKKTRAIFPAGPGEAVLYKPLANECVSCHGDHHQGQFGKDCRQCHGFDSFLPASKFDHSRTAFPLTGAHEGLDCRQCHNDKTPNLHGAGKTVKSETECTLCHRSPHLGQRNNCRECHSGKNWRVEPW